MQVDKNSLQWKCTIFKAWTSFLLITYWLGKFCPASLRYSARIQFWFFCFRYRSTIIQQPQVAKIILSSFPSNPFKTPHIFIVAAVVKKLTLLCNWSCSLYKKEKLNWVLYCLVGYFLARCFGNRITSYVIVTHRH